MHNIRLSAADVLGGAAVLHALPDSDLEWIALVREGIAVSSMPAAARVVGISSNELVRVLDMAPRIRSRSVSDVVLSGTLDVPAPPARLIADWERDTSLRLGLEPGDVEALSLARARSRWPHYRQCVQAVSDWTRTLGLPEVLASCDVALMACRGAKYHHDGAHYGGAAFCNLFLSEDRGLDMHFPSSGHRIPLTRGTVVLFDTGQPHAAIDRRSGGFNVADFPPEQDCTQIFLTWELPIENTYVAHALRIAFDIDPSTALLLDEEQVWRSGARSSVCQESGRWCQTG